MITKVTIRTYVKHMLSTNESWATRALIKVYANQTADEQASQVTSHNNSVGFSGVDAMILSSFAQQYQRWNRLSPKQMTILFKKMPRYWRQVMSLISEDKMPKLQQDAESYRLSMVKS